MKPKLNYFRAFLCKKNCHSGLARDRATEKLVSYISYNDKYKNRKDLLSAVYHRLFLQVQQKGFAPNDIVLVNG